MFEIVIMDLIFEGVNWNERSEGWKWVICV